MHAWKIGREANDDDDDGDEDGDDLFEYYIFLIFKLSRLTLAGQQQPNSCTSLISAI